MISPSSFPQLLLTVTAGNIFVMTGYHLHSAKPYKTALPEAFLNIYIL